MKQTILDVDLLAFEQGTRFQQAAVVDGLMRSLGTGFVVTTSDLPSALLDEAYGMLNRFFALEATTKRQFNVPEAFGQTGYTDTLVETAAGEKLPDWKEMLNWAFPLPDNHPLRQRFPTLYPEQLLPEVAVPGITRVLQTFHQTIAELQCRVLRIIATGLGCHNDFFTDLVQDAPTLTRAIRYPPMSEAPAAGHMWAAAHGDINLITALPRATAPGLQVYIDGSWVDAIAPEGQVIVNSGLMLERISNGLIPTGWHRVLAPSQANLERLSVVQFCHPKPSTLLTPLSNCVNESHPQRFAGVMAADALEEVLYKIKLMA
ncbi:Iron/Ascorbate oxidoreductase [Prochlorococcus marinus str. MIT 9313]|uniref:Iron/Ascorbate oxidoreductase n=1 Tax=Prochlorococcus marinus (strain MIT 9313) TaxID=74547 RepID=Q7TV72_PROMM|nr:2-oxoglutarate and iron-dependent oxygenase domain-containing protein [Prochlorococcus marinus]CAE20309.1 Iron/Ascorbate oxidoreductase [Prochlorococcus marinus str. MIT 9313]